MANEIQVPKPNTQTITETTEVSSGTAISSEPATHNYRAVQGVWFVVSLATTLIAIRFVLKLLGASLESGFVTFIYGLTDLLVAPFKAIFPTTGTASTVEVAALIGIVMWALAGYGVVALIKLFSTPKGARSAS